MSGEESPCSYDCARDGWIQHSLDGRFVYVGDSGDVFDAVANLLPLVLSLADTVTASDVIRRDVACDHEKRNSLTIADEITLVQPPTSALVLIVWLPNADVPVPSRTPPKAPGIWRVRFE